MEAGEFKRARSGPGGGRRLASLAAMSLGAGLGAVWGADEVDVSALPPPAARQVEFARDIAPIFERSCFQCHGPERPKSGFRLDRRAPAMKGGSSGVAILPGASARSPLIHYVAGLVEDMKMPPPGKAEALSPEEIGLLRAWIDQGAPWVESSQALDQRTGIVPQFGWYFVDGDEGKFREHHWVKEGWAGGVESFLLSDRVGEDALSELRGHVRRNDYRVEWTVDREAWGHVQGGYESYRRYYDDGGGFYEPLGERAPELNRSLSLDMGRFWFEAGLDRAAWPRLVAGYEYQFKEGVKSTTQWLPTAPGQGALSRGVLPSTKSIDEQVHLIRLDASHRMAGIDWDNRTRYELYDLSNRRDGIPTGTSAILDEDYSHRQFANTLTGEKQIKEWLLVSSGYLYTRTDGEASLREIPTGPAGGFDSWSGQGIDLERSSHTLSWSAQAGPWAGFGLHGAVQPEWSHQEGDGRVTYSLLAPVPGSRPPTIESDLDRLQVQEELGARYTGIPFTVLFAEARAEQERLDQFEVKSDASLSSVPDFRRDTDARMDGWDYRGGFHVSPWTPISWSGHYRRVHRDHHYDHDRDETFVGPPGLGYSAYVVDQDADTDEAEVKMAIKPMSWIKASLTYRWSETDYETRTEEGLATPAGTQHQAGRVRGHVYGASLTIAPWSRFYLTPSILYTDTRLVTYRGASVAPYEGDILTVLAAATYAVDDRTDWTATYSYSEADYGQDNVAGGLPLGIEYRMHGLLTGVRRRLNDHASLQVQYGYYRYREPSGGGWFDYRAHAVFSSLSVAIP